jgi:hypothetical protein
MGVDYGCIDKSQAITDQGHAVARQGQGASRAPAPPGLAADPDLGPDVRSPAFKAKAHRQSLAVAKSRHARADQDFIDAVSAWSSE